MWIMLAKVRAYTPREKRYINNASYVKKYIHHGARYVDNAS